MGRAVHGQRPVVLVVEDESLIVATAMDMVEEAGLDAIAASDADEAIGILESCNDIRADAEVVASLMRRLARA
jgi:CheY-like chemotaxis protein